MTDLCGAPAEGGPCAMEAGHNAGRLDVPSNHIADIAVAPRVDKITGEFFRKGKCAVCQKGVERTRSFAGATMSVVNAMGAEWGKTPLAHKRCEHLVPADVDA